MGHCVIFSGKQGAAPPSRILPVRLCVLLKRQRYELIPIPRSIISIVIFPQGFFIFIFHVLRNGDVHAEFDRKRQTWKMSRSIASSSVAKQNSSDVWTSMATNIVTNELETRTNETTSLPATCYDHPLFLSQQRSITPINM